MFKLCDQSPGVHVSGVPTVRLCTRACVHVFRCANVQPFGFHVTICAHVQVYTFFQVRQVPNRFRFQMMCNCPGVNALRRSTAQAFMSPNVQACKRSRVQVFRWSSVQVASFQLFKFVRFARCSGFHVFKFVQAFKLFKVCMFPSCSCFHVSQVPM